MKTVAVRLKDGDDLKQSLGEVASQNSINAGVILSGVGGLKQAQIRFPSTPDARKSKQWDEDLEIVSMTGTISAAGMHIHLSVSDAAGTTFGGHLMTGCTVRNTVELVIGILDSTTFTRGIDKDTGFEELIISENLK